MSDDRLRILYVIDSVGVGGAEMLLLGILKACKGQGHNASVAYFSDGPLHEEIRGLGIPIHRISRVGLKDPRATARIVNLIRQERPDVVHTHLRKSDLAGQPAAALTKVPVRVCTVHNTDPWRANPALSSVNRILTRWCQRVIAVSPEVRDYLIATGNQPSEKIVTIENGIDLERFDLGSTDPVNGAAQWGMADDSLIVGIIGRLEPQKGHGLFLQAAKEVVLEMPQARFLIIGDGPLRSELEHQRAQLGLTEQVIFAGLVRDVPATLAGLDAVVFSSLWEGLPVALLEAMAMERPVVATTVGGIPGVLNHNESGILVPPEDPQELARAVLGVLHNPESSAQLGRRARTTIRQRYSGDSMHERIFELYRSLH